MSRRAHGPRRVPRSWVGLFSFVLAWGAISAVPAAASTPTTSPAPITLYNVPGGTIKLGVVGAVTGCNPNTPNGNTALNKMVLTAVLPSVFEIDVNGVSQLDSQVVTQAELVTTTPETIVYTINPRAVWGDGVPITATDFIYAWHEQTASADKAPPDASTTLGYKDIKSVIGSNDGRTVTVVFAKTYGDWQQLFNFLVPAHIMTKTGWDPDCDNVSPTVDLSGGPFAVQSATPARITLVPNPRWWGSKVFLSKLVILLASSQNELQSWVNHNQVQVAYSDQFSQGFLTDMANRPDARVSFGLDNSFDELIFSHVSDTSASLDLRMAIAHAINRTQIANTVVDWSYGTDAPGTSHFFSQNQGAYVNQTDPDVPFDLVADDQATAEDLGALGDTKVHGHWMTPSDQPVSVRIAVDDGDLWAEASAHLIDIELQRAGFTTSTVPAVSAAEAGADLLSNEADVAVVNYEATPYPSRSLSWYTPTLNAIGQAGSEDWMSLNDPQLNATLAAAAQQFVPTLWGPIYKQADAIMWNDMDALPLFSEPNVLLYHDRITGPMLAPNTEGLLYNAPVWGYRAPLAATPSAKHAKSAKTTTK